MAYEINVSKGGKHYFATDARSITSMQDLLGKVADFHKRFPVEEGFEVQGYRVETTSRKIDAEGKDA